MASYTSTVERVLQGDLHEASEAEKNQSVRDVIQVCGAASGAMANQPLPFVDIALIAPIQIVTLPILLVVSD